MKKIIAVLLLLVFGRYACGQDIVATTSVLASAVREIGGNRIKVTTLVPYGSCPGHFDLKASHLRLIERSGVLFAHGFEGYLEKIKASIRHPGLKPFKVIQIVEVEGNWLVPAAQMEAYGKISEILSGLFPRNRDFFEAKRINAENKIIETDIAVKKIVESYKLKGVPVICNSHIKDLLEYIGFNVIGVYGRKEELTASDIKKLVLLAKKENVRLVIDNLQAGPDTGTVIASQLKISHIAISNFPGVFPGTDTLRQTLHENVRRIASVYEKKNKF
ncbi:MAG TPA: metal ABC transporter substrate-binding protein [bacterium]|nr:metal ABC transporter substrate-binding protein [bacterium]